MAGGPAGKEQMQKGAVVQMPMVCRTRLSLSLRWPENIM